ncbi:MAG: radical SAM protein [Holosporales bacterium]|jgi:uncharacterized protein|nr:radical SAM protein [Holosporales bacterium]
MVLSKFNFSVPREDDLLVFNSLKNTLSVFPKEMLADFEDNENVESIEFLTERGILVDDDFDEDKAALIKYYSVIDDGTLELILLPSMNCNFRCPYCYEKKTPDKMSPEVIKSILLFTKRNITQARSLHVSWFGGEPLLCMDIIEEVNSKLMDLARAYRKSFTSNMTTNGYTLNLETFRHLTNDLHITHYQITIDGRAQYHDKTRPLAGGGPTHDRIIENLLSIKESTKSKLFTILVRTNLTKDTLLDLDNHIAELEQHFGNDKRFVFLFKEVGDWGGETVKDISNSLLGTFNEEELVSPLTKKLSSLKTTLTLSGQFPFFNGVSVCYAAKMGTYTIDPWGKVMRCTVNLDSDYNHIGVLDKKGVLVANDKALMKWQYCGMPVKCLPEKCHNCALYANCFGIMCPVPHVCRNGKPQCETLHNDLLAMYKSNPKYFKHFKEEE